MIMALSRRSPCQQRRADASGSQECGAAASRGGTAASHVVDGISAFGLEANLEACALGLHWTSKAPLAR